MMSKLNIKLMALLGGAALSFASGQAFATTVQGTANAEIVAPIVITPGPAMDFAFIAPDATGDTVTITPAGAISAVSGNTTLSGTAVAGTFDVTGTASQNVSITFSTGDVLTGPGADMALDNFQHDQGGTPALDGTGNLAIAVGADLTVGASQTEGAYTGTYDITVDYN